MKNRTIASLFTKGSRSINLSAHAPLLLFLFANLVILVSDVRVYDYLNVQTGSWWKALIGCLGCAIPFFLWEVAWGYNSTTEGWRAVSLVMAGLAFVTSILIGVADYVGMIGVEWATWLLGMVVVEIGIHAVVGLLYYYNDPDVARVRHKKQAEAVMADQQLNAKVAQELLAAGRGVLDVISQLEREYDPEDVRAVIGLLTGEKEKTPTESKAGRKGGGTPVPQPIPTMYKPSSDGSKPGKDEKVTIPVKNDFHRPAQG